jgi:hypothetical protein
MDHEQQAQLDAQVQQALQELREAGEPVTAEGVRGRVGRRMSDVLEAIRRVAVGTPDPDADTDPEQYPAVREASAKVARLTVALAQAEADLREAEQARLLSLAVQLAKERQSAALETAQREHRARQWRRYQTAIAAMIEAGDAFALAQDEAMRVWNAVVNQHGEPPLFRGSVQVWRENFRPFLMGLTQVTADEVPPAAPPPTFGPRAY